MLAVNFSSINLLLESSEIQKLRFSSVGFKVLFGPGSLTLTGCHTSGAFDRTHSGRVRRAAHCWVSGDEPDSTEPRQRPSWLRAVEAVCAEMSDGSAFSPF